MEHSSAVYVFPVPMSGRLDRKHVAYPLRSLLGCQDGVAKGKTGRGYAFPTHDVYGHFLPYGRLGAAFEDLLLYARDHPQTVLRVLPMAMPDRQIDDFFTLMDRLTVLNIEIPVVWKVKRHGHTRRLLVVSPDETHAQPLNDWTENSLAAVMSEAMAVSEIPDLVYSVSGPLVEQILQAGIIPVETMRGSWVLQGVVGLADASLVLRSLFFATDVLVIENAGKYPVPNDLFEIWRAWGINVMVSKVRRRSGRYETVFFENGDSSGRVLDQ